MAQCLVSVVQAFCQLPASLSTISSQGSAPRSWLPALWSSRRSLLMYELGARLQPSEGRAGWANGPALGLRKGGKRMNYSPHPALFKFCSLLRGSRRLVMGP